jgi:hypothetical protein
MNFRMSRNEPKIGAHPSILQRFSLAFCLHFVVPFCCYFKLSSDTITTVTRTAHVLRTIVDPWPASQWTHYSLMFVIGSSHYCQYKFSWAPTVQTIFHPVMLPLCCQDICRSVSPKYISDSQSVWYTSCSPGAYAPHQDPSHPSLCLTFYINDARLYDIALLQHRHPLENWGMFCAHLSKTTVRICWCLFRYIYILRGWSWWRSCSRHEQANQAILA